jgi:BirA family transcriptional regulator, biotin operon repressor / biotin---[acetyl-CoA-carboxylase] ligase
MAAYCSDRMGGTLRPERVEPRLRGRFGHPYVWRASCPSTQELARGLPHGGVAACEEQTAGRGQLGRAWVSPAGKGILCSLALRPRTPVDRLAAFSLVAAEAVCEATLDRAAVRWPNDVVVDGRKLAGVLVEVRDGAMVVGVGLNANLTPDELPGDARVPPTSLQIETGAAVDRADVLADLLWALERRFEAFEAEGFPGLVRDDLRGHRVRLAGGGEGVCSGTDAQGRLVVGGRAVTSDEVTAVLVDDAAGRTISP